MRITPQERASAMRAVLLKIATPEALAKSEEAISQEITAELRAALPSLTLSNSEIKAVVARVRAFALLTRDDCAQERIEHLGALAGAGVVAADALARLLAIPTLPQEAREDAQAALDYHRKVEGRPWADYVRELFARDQTTPLEIV